MATSANAASANDTASTSGPGPSDETAEQRPGDTEVVNGETAAGASERGDVVPTVARQAAADLDGLDLDGLELSGPDVDDGPMVIGPAWGLPFGLGLLSIGFGAAVLASSERGLPFFAVLVGAWLFTSGAARVTAAVVARETDTMGELVYSALAGSLVLVGGVLSLRGLVTDVLLVVGCLAVAWLLAGFADLMLATADQPGSGWLAVSGVLGLAVGVGFLLLPTDLVSVAVPLTGTTALFAGVVWVVVALGARSASRRARHWYRSGGSDQPATLVPEGSA